MTPAPAELELINARIFPALLGGRLLCDRPPGAVDMGYAEAALFEALLSHLRPACAIEIGTETGVTLATIARHSTHSLSLDIDPGVKQRLAPRFPSVEFLTGSSHDLLPPLLSRLAASGITPDFIFVDGDHSADGVRRDLETILTFQPHKPMFVLMHDTFNPGCRQGILAAPWAGNPRCHFVELDFVPGLLHPNPSCYRQMWGGLGLALFLPEPRAHALRVHTTHQLLYEAALLQSVHHQGPRR